jgi:hypothetical protein
MPSAEEKCMPRHIHIALAAFLLPVAAMVSAAPASTMGMVLDLQGSGDLLRKGDSSKLQLLSYVQAGVQLRLAAGSKASVSHYAAKQIYQLTGPVLVQVDPDQLRLVEGTPLASKPLAEKVVTAALNPGTGPAAFRMRSLTPIMALAPANGSSVLSTRPQFSWEASEATRYEVELIEVPERVVAHAKVDAPRWELPAALKLDYGKNYRWTVSYTSTVDGKTRSAQANFQLPSKAEAESILALAPGKDAAVDEWVLYATILKDRQLHEDARAVWRQIAAQRPDLAPAR